jgi:hypothetical protein
MFRRIWFICGFIYSTMSSYAAIDIIFDYSYDTGNYFGDEQRYIMEQVAYVFESRITSGFTSTRPEDITGATGVTANLYFRNPTTQSIVEPVIGSGSMTADGNEIGKENELIIFLGARNTGFSSSSVLASASATNSYVSSYSSSSARDAWNARKNSKDTSSVFQPVAGSSQVNSTKSFYFDTDLTTHTDAEVSGKVDFYTVMVHEIGHIMGFNTHNAWNANLSGSNWTGAEAMKEYSLENPPNGEAVPLVSSTNPHWNLGLDYDKVNCGCHPSMLPSVSSNKRTTFSDLDFALLKDIGYSISDNPIGTNIGGTYSPARGGTYDIPVSMTYDAWLAIPGNSGNGSGGFVSPASAAPEPAYIFTLMGGLLAFLGGRKNLGKIKTLLRIA